MKKTSGFFIAPIFSVILVAAVITSCRKTENPIKFEFGTFPDTLVTLDNLNTVYDDYNTSVYQLNGSSTVVFSSNRKSSGGQFDLEQANISFIFNQETGEFGMASEMISDPFISKLIAKAQTSGNDFGPYRFYSSLDGYEYFVLSSENGAGKLDLFYMRNRPVFSGTILPDIEGKYAVNLLNTGYDDAYLSFDSAQDTAYFCSDRSGNFDIYLHARPENTEINKWFNQSFTASTKVDSINTASDDKCPLVYKKILIFTSNRPGGLGGYDLYYSVFRHGNWSSPVNMGPKINSAYDEYRPLIGFDPNFTNNFLMFSSNRPGGKGGFDLYFTGYTFPSK